MLTDWNLMQIGLVGAAFAAGLLSFFSPCILPLLPVYIGLLTTDADASKLSRSRGILNTIAFVLGISVTFLILGLGAGAIGRFLANPVITIAFGLIIFVFGLALSGFVNIPFLQREKRVDMSKINTTSVVGAFLLGLGFSFGWTPCVGPILGSILALAATQGSAAAGAALTLVYALGLCIPFLVISIASSILLEKVRALHKYLPIIQRIGGVLIAIMGLWMIFSTASGLPTFGTGSNAAATSEQGDASTQDDAEVQSSALDIEEEDDLETLSGHNDWRDLVLEDIDGQKHTFAEYEGKPIYIEFWGTWCSVCMDSIDELEQTAQKYNSEGNIQVITVVAPGYYGEKNRDDFVAWAHEQNLDIPILMDLDDELNSYFAIGAYPTSLFVDSTGSVQLVRTGAIGQAELDQLLSELE